MVKRHLKRINAPKTWKIQRKGIKFTTKTNPGGMSKALTMPVANVLKYELNVVGSVKETKHLVSTGEVLVNGNKITDYRYPVCFTDVVSLPKANKYFRMVIGTDGILRMMPISKEESTLKIAKIA